MTLPAPLAALGRVFVAACVGAASDVKAALAAARAAGTAPLAIDEALLLVVAYAGVPRAILAFGAWREIEPLPTPAPSVTDRPAAGAHAFASVYGERTDRVRREIEALHPELHAAVIEDSYGRILARSGLAAVERELLAVAMLTALRAPRQTAAHAIGARRAGASSADVLEAAGLAAPYVTEDEIEDARRRLA